MASDHSKFSGRWRHNMRDIMKVPFKLTKLTILITLTFTFARSDIFENGDVKDQSPVVSLSVTPIKPTVGLTPTLEMRCAVKSVNGKTNGASLFLLRISRDGANVASVTSRGGAKSWADHSKLTVTGHFLEKNEEDLGYLKLKWDNPNHEQDGRYHCKAQLFDSDGNDLLFTKGLEVRMDDPDISAIVDYVKGELEKTNANVKENRELVSSRVPRIEQGHGNCGPDQWIRFSKPYDRPPVVVLSTRHLDFGAHRNVRWQLWLMAVRNDRFQVHCNKWADTDMYGASFTWLSIEQ